MTCYCCEKHQEMLILESDFWIIELSSNQAYLGCSLVISKRHCGSLSELTVEEWLDLQKIVVKMELALKKAFDATLFNWSCLMNNFYKSNMSSPHVHFHLRPRYNHDVSIDDEVFLDTEFGHHYNKKRTKEITVLMIQKIIQAIQENL